MQNETSQKLLVCGISFSTACAGLSLSLFVLIPLLGSLMLYFQLPSLVTQSVILVTMFAPSIVAALIGINIADRIIVANTKAAN